jgi:hypothetical protein
MNMAKHTCCWRHRKTGKEAKVQANKHISHDLHNIMINVSNLCTRTMAHMKNNICTHLHRSSPSPRPPPPPSPPTVHIRAGHTAGKGHTKEAGSTVSVKTDITSSNRATQGKQYPGSTAPIPP